MTLIIPEIRTEAGPEAGESNNNFAWNPSQKLTLGVECEIQLVDWKTQDLCPAASRVLPLCASGLIKNEIYQSMVELSTGVCTNLSMVEADLRRGRQDLLKACVPLGLEPIGNATHPIAPRQERILTPGSSRYALLLERNQWIARRMGIFGLHVHIGVPKADHAVHLMNGLVSDLACLLALSSSSPFWGGEDTGLASSRATVFESQPTGGCPPSFLDWEHFTHYCQRLLRSRSIVSLKDLWWDVRPNPNYGTIEVRICDGTASLSETLAIVALIQCLCARQLESIEHDMLPAPPSDWRTRENKWRAMRWGLEADLIEDDEGGSLPARVVIQNWLDKLLPYAQKLECQHHLHKVQEILEAGSSSQRQRQVYATTGSLRAVVQQLAQEWRQA